MKRLFIMRHGETLFNVMDVNQGQCDSPLTGNGIRQAKMAGQWFRDQGIQFDSVYSSTAERACDTAELVAGMPYTRCKGLKEIYLGTKEAGPNSENPTYPYGDYFVKYGGEDLDAFTERIYKEVKDIADYDEGQTLLLVSHGMAIRRLLKAIGYVPEVDQFIGNCGIVELEYNGAHFTVKRIVNPCA